jgi:hypothetical protein
MASKLKRLIDWLIPSGSDESETERTGFLSTRREIHSATIGLAVGFIVAMTTAWELGALFLFTVLGVKLENKYLGDIQKEPWYAAGFFMAGIALARLGVLFSLLP